MTDDLELLTEAQVAAILHKKVGAVRRLRSEGKLAFIPGRPVTITRAALVSYIGSNSRIHVRSTPKTRYARPRS